MESIGGDSDNSVNTVATATQTIFLSGGVTSGFILYHSTGGDIGLPGHL